MLFEKGIAPVESQEDIYKVGTLCSLEIDQMNKGDGTKSVVILRGEKRVIIESLIKVINPQEKNEFL